jgi:hypothetical protein
MVVQAIIPLPGRLRQEYHKFEANLLGYTVRQKKKKKSLEQVNTRK